MEKLETIIQHLKNQIDPEDIVISIGGDGSLNSIVTLFEKYDIQNDLGYIPSGSGNDFARSHNMPIDTEEAIKYLFQLKEPKDLTILHATEGDQNYYAVNSIGIGIDGLVIDKVHKNSFKKWLGPASYISNILTAFIQLKTFPLKLQVDDGVYTFDQAQLALVVNNPYFGGGIKIVPDADGTDDTLEIVVGENVSGKNLAQILTKLFKDGSHLAHPKLHLFRTKKAALFIDATHFAQKDGEPFTQEGFALTFQTKKRSFWI